MEVHKTLEDLGDVNRDKVFRELSESFADVM
jgi:hypothetical protein